MENVEGCNKGRPISSSKAVLIAVRVAPMVPEEIVVRRADHDLSVAGLEVLAEAALVPLSEKTSC